MANVLAGRMWAMPERETSEKQWSGRGKMRGRANLLPPRRENLYGKKFIMCGKRNMALAHPNRLFAIGLSKARRAASKARNAETPAPLQKRAEQDFRARQREKRPTSPRRSRAAAGALKRESHKAASRQALFKQAQNVSHEREKRARHQAAAKAARTRKAA